MTEKIDPVEFWRNLGHRPGDGCGAAFGGIRPGPWAEVHRWKRTALPKCLQLRYSHGSDPADPSLERISIWDGTHSRTLVARVWVVAEDIDDWAFWSQPPKAVPSIADWGRLQTVQYLDHQVREQQRAQFFGDDGDVLAEERF